MHTNTQGKKLNTAMVHDKRRQERLHTQDASWPNNIQPRPHLCCSRILPAAVLWSRAKRPPWRGWLGICLQRCLQRTSDVVLRVPVCDRAVASGGVILGQQRAHLGVRPVNAAAAAVAAAEANRRGFGLEIITIVVTVTVAVTRRLRRRQRRLVRRSPERLQVADELEVGAVPLRPDELGRPRDEQGGQGGAQGWGHDVRLPAETGEDQRRCERRPGDRNVEAGREAHAHEGRARGEHLGGKDEVGDGHQRPAQRRPREEEGEDEPSLGVDKGTVRWVRRETGKTRGPSKLQSWGKA